MRKNGICFPKVFLVFALIAMLALPRLADAATVQQVRFSQSPEKVRVVFDLDAVPAYSIVMLENPLRLVLDFSDTAGRKGLAAQTSFNDPALSSLRLGQPQPGKFRAVVDLKTAVTYKIITLQNPNRLVLDIFKVYEQKIPQQIIPGLTLTTVLKGQADGPVRAFVLDAAPNSALLLKPVLSNGVISGLDTVQAMAQQSKAIAAVNGSYFSLNGEIIGLLKLDGTIVSTPELPRAAVGWLPDGKYLIDEPSFTGQVTLPDNTSINIAGVNRERGVDELILYNSYYGASTGSNSFGADYVIADGKVSAIVPCNAAIPDGGAVLSAHGAANQKLASLKVGDTVKITQSLGEKWDDASQVLGAGPMLLKDGSVFLTTKVEEFASDVAGGRAPRTAFGVTPDGHVLLAVVDGRQKDSIGMTLLELALFMQEMGAANAINLDGGGSSEIVVNDQVLNSPSDGRERRVGDAVVVISSGLAH